MPPSPVRAALLALLLALVLAASAEARLPAGFMGVVGDNTLFYGAHVNLDRELALMRSNGVQTLRVPFDWATAQPSSKRRPDLFESDRIVAAAARHGLTVLPVVVHMPSWDAADPRHPIGSPPKTPGPYAAYLRVLVDRYGPRGSLWRGRHAPPKHAIRAWQIANEPNLKTFWSIQPFAKRYVALLKASSIAIHKRDRGATVVIGGLTNGAGSPAWTALGYVYRAGGKRWFDEVAVHPYTGTPQHVLETLQRTRAVMARYGDARKRIAVTEMSWSSSNGTTTDRFATWDTTERGQARELTAAYRLLARNRVKLRLVQVDWYSWISPQVVRGNWSDYAGLRKVSGSRVVSKPALAAYRDVARALARGR